MAEDVPFGALLRGLRLAADLTLEQLAEAAGVSDRAISDMERGVSRRPRARTVDAVADGLAATAADRSALLAAARAGRNAAPAAPMSKIPLPRHVADFTGREPELAEVAGRVGDARNDAPAPIVTISGAAGVGKTTFAVHVAQDWAAEEQLFVDLRGLDAQPLTPITVLTRLIRALSDGTTAVPRDLDEASALWQTLIRGRRMVIVLDNAVSESQVRPVLPPHGPAVVLVTSRRSLSGLEDVHRIRLEPLPETDAVALLGSILDRIGASPDQLRRIAGLCVHIPLALRIAGNRLVSRPGWTADDLIGRLAAQERRLDALTAGDLRIKAAFDLSYQQLSGVARRLFRRLALVPGSSTGPELASVLVEESLPVTEDALDELVDLSLLQQRPDGRLEFHDLLRLYASGELDREEGVADRAAAAARRDAWLLDTAIVAGRFFEPDYGAGKAGVTEVVEFASPDQASDWLRAEAENWLPALRAAADAGADQRVADVAEALHWFSDTWSLWTGWEDVFTLSAAAAARLRDDVQQAVHEGYLAWVHLVCLGRPEIAFDHARAALECARRSGDRRQIGWGNYYVSWSLTHLDRHADGVGFARAAVAEFRAVRDREGVPNGLLQLAGGLSRSGSTDEAIVILGEVLDTVRDPATAPPPQIARLAERAALSFLSMIELNARRWSEALARTDEEIELIAGTPDSAASTARALARRALIHARSGDVEAARADQAELRRLVDRTGNLTTRPGNIRDRIEEVERLIAAHDETNSTR